MTFICDNDELVKQGKKYFNDWIMDDKKFNRVKKSYAQAVRYMEEVEDKILNLNKLNKVQLKRLYLDFYEQYLTFWDHGLVPEMANWGGEVILKENLKTVPANDFMLVYEKLSAPTGLSFYKQEELDLLRVKRGEVKLNEHVKKYFWINNSYLDSVVLSEKFFKDRLAEMNKTNNFILQSKRDRQKYLKKYKLSSQVKKISNRLGYCIYWQDERKGRIFKANHYIKLFLEEFSCRYNLPLSYLEQYWCWELPDLLRGQKVSVSEMENRLKEQAGYMIAAKERNDVITSKEFVKNVRPILQTRVANNVKEIKGMCVNTGSGLVSGKAKILLDHHDFGKMKNGDVLVAPMTSPEYILAMRKAVAVVTDAGGMTCHAAIVSRELGVPCIVGTKIATRVLKDGDLVEIDANNGIVRKIVNQFL
ncbi:hypothetical protein HZC21_04085 [Candidatus Peregrinibacteria bacterium]|nr:hypothetical protein [Candidatus Peregrinibacteria bacterium]